MTMKAAVIGVGYLGQFHAEKYAKSKKAELSAVVDVDSARAERCAGKLRCRALTDYRALDGMDVRCVSIASDTRTHFEVAKWCLENGIDVLVEKPMTVTAAEAQELIDLAARNGRILQVGHLERFNPAFQAMRGVLNNPRFFEVRRIGQFAGRNHDVNVIHDLMIHDIDIVTHLVNRPVTKIEAIGIPVLTSSVDIANARLTFEGGAVANVTASRAAFKVERTFRIFQPELYISIDFGQKKLKIYEKGGGKTLLGFPEIKITEYKVEERDALADEIESFLECVSQRTPPLVGGEDGLRALQLVEQINAAMEETVRGAELTQAG